MMAPGIYNKCLCIHVQASDPWTALLQLALVSREQHAWPIEDEPEYIAHMYNTQPLFGKLIYR